MIQYVIINEKARIDFEKKHQVPYGYAAGTFAFSLMEALSTYAEIPRDIRDHYIIEKIVNGNVSIIYPEEMKKRFVE